MDEPWLGDSRQHAPRQDLHYDLAHDIPLRLWLVILWWQARLEYMVDSLANVHGIYDTVRGNGHMGLRLVE